MNYIQQHKNFNSLRKPILIASMYAIFTFMNGLIFMVAVAYDIPFPRILWDWHQQNSWKSTFWESPWRTTRPKIHLNSVQTMNQTCKKTTSEWWQRRKAKWTMIQHWLNMVTSENVGNSRLQSYLLFSKNVRKH